ncbi:MAG TPA: histone deacetylase [Candidatus Sulfomarinibacteraceae bacterium]|nr:histone deacetylase [Candidatus Sulfomarinibacteraceae bacterium]
MFYEPALAHTRNHHPENKRRLSGILPFLEERGVLGDLVRGEGQPASMEQLLRVHSERLVKGVRQAVASGQRIMDADTYVTGKSFALAQRAAGACCVAVEHILDGDAGNGIALVRPPGHHAERERVGGFCLFNNVAVAARQAQVAHGVRQILIVDFDVHHGNGTQDIFYDDDTVLFVSLHLYHPFFYPGSGALDEIGTGAGRGLTLNVPFPPHVGDRGYGQAMQELILPRARQFGPEMILVSAGFDAHWKDPLASAGLSLTGYAQMTQNLVALADELCQGRILFVLEGGYHVPALHYGLLNVINALLKRDQIMDPLGPLADVEEDVTNLLRKLRELHLLN